MDVQESTGFSLGISQGGSFTWWKASGKVRGRFWVSLVTILLLSWVFYNVPSPLGMLKMFEPLIIPASHSYWGKLPHNRARVCCSQPSCSAHISSTCPIPLAWANRIHMWKWWLHIWAGCHFHRHQPCDFILPLWHWQGTRSPKYETLLWNKIPLKWSLYGLKEKTEYAKQKQMGHSYFCPMAELLSPPSLLGILSNSANIMNIEFQISQVRAFLY